MIYYRSPKSRSGKWHVGYEARQGTFSPISGRCHSATPAREAEIKGVPESGDWVCWHCSAAETSERRSHR